MTMQFQTGIRITCTVLALLSMAIGSLHTGAGQEASPAPTNAPSAVDLATVPLHPSAFPERGYQLSQAGDLEFDGFSSFWTGEETEIDAWQPIADHYRQGYSAVHVLLTDRADSWSQPLATVTSMIVGFDSPEAAASGEDTLIDVLGLDEAELVDDVTVFAGNEGTLGMLVRENYLVLVQYGFPEQQFSTQQNTEDWTPESVAELVTATGDLLDEAIAAADQGEDALGVANVMFYGDLAAWTIPWPNYPSTEHYRVLDGEVMPYGGELSADAEAVTWPGLDDLFVSRQQVGAEGYDQVIDVTLARFETDEQAADFALEPDQVAFPPTWQFEATYANPHSLTEDVRIERATVRDDALRASGYRTVRQDGNLVQVVQWLGSGNALIGENAVTWLTGLQSDCLDALPDPCQPVWQDEIPLAIDERGNRGFPEPATPVGEATPDDESVLASLLFGWQVALPGDDAWTITGAEFYANSELFQLQSGRSLMTVESVVDQHGDPQQCVLDNLALLEEFEERAVIDLGSDDPDERPAGSEQGHGWAIYTVEPLQEERADQEYTIRYDCYTLVEGQTSLVVTHTAPRDLWTEEREKGERFRDGIELPASATSAITLPAGDRRNFGRTLTMGIPRIWIPLAA
jgi:hypothetical protein